MTGWINSFALHNIFRCLSASCCALMYTAGSMICKAKDIFFLSKPIHYLLTFSFRYYKWKIQSFCNLLIRTILVNWCNAIASDGKFLDELGSPLYCIIFANNTSHFYVAICKKPYSNQYSRCISKDFFRFPNHRDGLLKRDECKKLKKCSSMVQQ